MTDLQDISINNSALVEPQSPQCQYFVVRKKRLCRMTVRPGRHYCGEHETAKTEGGKDDTRIPCPNDPKHTCYASKLQKHLSICNARLTELPPYIVPNINKPEGEDEEKKIKVLLSQVPEPTLKTLIDKINRLYDKYLLNNIETASERPIHPSVLSDFSEEDRAESSRRHLRQASSLLWIAEEQGLVQPGTCYVELGAGKGHLSYYAWGAWCSGAGAGAGAAGGDSRVLLVDRASLRHKRDNKLRDNQSPGTEEGGETASVVRIRADLADVCLARAPGVPGARALVGLAKHLCGGATDLALRCVTAGELAGRTAGCVLATCCHHRCQWGTLAGTHHLQEMGITKEDFKIILGIVSWATCGDGRPREPRSPAPLTPEKDATVHVHIPRSKEKADQSESSDLLKLVNGENPEANSNYEQTVEGKDVQVDVEGSPVSKRPEPMRLYERLVRAQQQQADHCMQPLPGHYIPPENMQFFKGETDPTNLLANIRSFPECSKASKGLKLPREEREAVGRKAKALLDWARVLFLRDKGFDARLCFYVSTDVSPENVCIVAKKLHR